MGGYAHQHIAPRSYLAAWAVDGVISAHFVRTGETRPVSITDAAVRKHFYSVKLPDGTQNVAFERELGRFESKAVPVLRSLEDRWPVAKEDRAILSEFIALQIVRGPLWRTRMMELGRATLEEHKATKPHLSADVWAQVEDANLSRRGILEFMVSQLDKVGTLVGSMHWTLMSFKRPRLATCDHPVSMIDINVFRGVVDPEALPRTGLLSAVEIRFPVSPTQGLVLSWLDGPDSIRERVWAGDQANFNYATRAQADVQWFSRPGEPIRAGTKEYPLLTLRTDPRYSIGMVESSQRRRATLDLVHAKIEGDDDPGQITIVEPVPIFREPG